MNEFKPFDRVLVRDEECDEWSPALFDRKDKEGREYPFKVICGEWYIQCIPYEGNEHLAGTTNAPEKEWEPQVNELVAVSSDGNIWAITLFKKMCNETFLCNYGIAWALCEPLRKHFPDAFISEK
jgi:hypothetical protein